MGLYDHCFQQGHEIFEVRLDSAIRQSQYRWAPVHIHTRLVVVGIGADKSLFVSKLNDDTWGSHNNKELCFLWLLSRYVRTGAWRIDTEYKLVLDLHHAIPIETLSELLWGEGEVSPTVS